MKRVLLYFFFLMLVTGPIAAQQVDNNGPLKNLINQSFSYFPKLNEAQNNTIIAQNQVELANSNTLQVNGTADYTYIRPKITLPFPMNGETVAFQFAPVHAGNAAVEASYVLFDFGKLKANVDQAKTGLQLANHNIDYIKNQLAYQIANIYYNIVYYKKAIAIEDSVIGYLAYNKQIVSSKLKYGEAIKNDVLNIQASIDNESNTRENLKNALEKQYSLLAYTTGNASQEVPTDSFDFELPLTNEEQAFLDAETNNPDFELAKDKVAQNEAAINIAKLMMRPSVTLHGSTGWKNGYVPNVNELRYNYQAGISLNVPIYNGNKQKKQIALNESQKKQSELAIQTLENDYKKDIRQAFIDLHTSQNQIGHTRSQIAEAIEAEKLATTRFVNGVGTNLEITNASTNVQKAQFAKLQYEYQACLAKVQLSKLLGNKYW
ncbi:MULTISPECIES: TolC family protein [Chitinophagaceae]